MFEEVVDVAAISLAEDYGGADDVDVPVGVCLIPFLEDLFSLPFGFAVVVEWVLGMVFVGVDFVQAVDRDG